MEVCQVYPYDLPKDSLLGRGKPIGYLSAPKSPISYYFFKILTSTSN